MIDHICAICSRQFRTEKKKSVTCSHKCRGVYARSFGARHDMLALFNRHVVKNESGACWGWRGRLNFAGYAMINDQQGRAVRAHRFSYELSRGPIGQGLEIDHLCSNRSCTNPEHLEPVSHPENSRRTAQRRRHWAHGRTHCKNGHLLQGNTRVIHRKCGRIENICAICEAARKARWENKHKRPAPATWAALDQAAKEGGGK